MIIPPDGKPGQILVRDQHGAWNWMESSELTRQERTLRHFAMYVAAIVVGLLTTALVLCFLARTARATDLPPGFTCRQAQAIALQIGADLRWDRERTRAIAASYGVVLTEAQLDRLQRCFQ